MGDVTAGHCGLVLDMVGASSPDSFAPSHGSYSMLVTLTKNLELVVREGSKQ